MHLLRSILLLAALPLLALATEPAPFAEYDCSRGRVIGHQAEPPAYIVRTPAASGVPSQVIGIPANGEPSAAAIEADITNPPAPAVAVPAEVTRRQLFLWLNAQGRTRAQIRAVLEAIPDATAREAALIEFDEAQTFRRDHPLIAQLAAALGYTAAQIDAGFIAAAAL